MPISATLVAPQRALGALDRAITDAKGGDNLAPVTVAVATNTCGVMTRRALGRATGIVAVDMVTLNRLAELIAGPLLAAQGRSPMSTPIVDLTIASVLADHPGPYASVAEHPSTIVALRELHAELRLAGDDAVSRLAGRSVRGRQAIRVSAAVHDALAPHWYDEADLFALATMSVADEAVPSALRSMVLYLPDQLPRLAVDFVTTLSRRIDVRVVAQLTGAADADAAIRALLDELGVLSDDIVTQSDPLDDVGGPPPTQIITVTDADEEVRAATRAIVDAVREGTPFERIAVLWPASTPYARLVEHHLTAADIPWNGQPGTTVAERLAPRLVLDLLDVDRRGLRRRSLFDLLADVPVRGSDGDFLPTASWERVSRQAGVARDDDWNPRLGALSGSDRWSGPATSLRDFVSELRSQLGHPNGVRTWEYWASWCGDQVEARLGRLTLERLAEPEYRAYESLTMALDRLGHLDPVSGPVTRHRFRATLEAELDSMPSRVGRVGHGVTIGSLGGAVGLDVDVVVVLGAAEGLLPPTPRSDPLLSDADRAIAGLPTADARALRLRRLLHAVLATSNVTVTAPRGDLRATAGLQLSRWVTAWTEGRRDVDSHRAGLEATTFPASHHEHRLRGRATAVGPDGRLVVGLDEADDVLRRGIAVLDARLSNEFTAFDGNLARAVGLPRLSAAVSPSQLEAWSACPHAYFAHHLLDVTPVEEPGDEIRITARDRGTAHHRALDLFHRSVVEGTLDQPGTAGWGDAHRRALVGCFDAVCERTERRGRTGRPAMWADERARMLDDLLTWLEHDSRLAVERGSTVLASEMRFDEADGAAIVLPDGRPITLRGSVDRVDRMGDGALVVTDHKSGGKDPFKGLSADDPTLGGSVFQLPSYAAAARVRFGDPDTPVLAEYGLLRRGGYARPGYLVDRDVDDRVGASLASVVAGIESGTFPNVPERPGWRMYVTCEYCEPDHLGTAERWSQWERKRSDPALSTWFAPEAVDS